jgi:hypothetical protein
VTEFEQSTVDTGTGTGTDTDAALAEAMARGDRRAFFTILTRCPLYQPAFPDSADVLTVRLFGETFVVVFTSPSTLLARVGSVTAHYTATTYPRLRRTWPAGDWRLAINPDTPLEAYVSVEALEQAARGVLTVPTTSEIVAAAALEQAPPCNDVERALLAAIEARDVDGYANALLDADVIVPVNAPVDEDDLSRLAEPDFPYRSGGSADDPAIPVFTSNVLLEAVCGAGQPVVTVPFAVLAGVWPAGYRLIVNPGSSTEMELPDDAVPLLVAWPAQPAQPDEPDALAAEADSR